MTPAPPLSPLSCLLSSPLFSPLSPFLPLSPSLLSPLLPASLPLPFPRRLDYFVLSERLMKDVCECVVRSEVMGSDHCPLVLSMAMS